MQLHLFPPFTYVHMALVKKGERTFEISPIKHTSSVPSIPLACPSTAQLRAEQDGSGGLFPQ